MPILKAEYFNIPAGKIPGGVVSSYIEEISASDVHYLRIFQNKGYVENLEDSFKRFRERFKKMILIGMGGSSLGAKSLICALGGENKNVVFLDNIDPDGFPLAHLSLDSDTCIVVVSKSGNTLETLSLFIRLVDMLNDLGMDWKERTLFITGGRKGYLQEIARKFSIPSLTIPDQIPGRFSVFSAVGLFPVAFSGIPINEVIKGAEESLEELKELGPSSMHARLSSAMMALTSSGRTIMVNFVYSKNLVPLSEWISQLVAESLGKKGLGITPIVSKGPPSQHSQLQLYKEGPADKFYLFYRKESFGGDNILRSSFDGLSFLKGKTLSSILLKEEEGTRSSLVSSGNPAILFRFSGPTPEELGYFMHLWMATVAILAKAMGVDPYTQDGVEEGKRITLDLLREGSER